MKRYLFICNECGAQYWLQSWKAVCPSCKAEFTLMEVKQEGPKKPYTNLFAGVLIASYLAYAFMVHEMKTAFTLLYLLSPLPYVLFLLLALFVAVGNEPALWTSIIVAAVTTVFHLFSFTFLDLIAVILNAAAASSSLHYLLFLRKLREHVSDEPDPRSMPEYSGWAGS